MNKQDAKRLAESEKTTIGELRAMIATAATRGGMSRVNRAFSMDQVCKIYAGALAGKDDAEIPKAWRADPYSATGAMKPSRNVLIVTNILRDCA